MASDDVTIGFFGGAGEVTGSRHLLDAGGTRLLFDCGMFQGHRKDAREKNCAFPFPPESLASVLLSHAHIDHSGALPLLSKKGSRAPILCTAVTHELCALMLKDSARLQEADARFFNKIHASDGQSISPLYTEEDVEAVLRDFRPCEFEAALPVGPGLQARFLNAGHVLGSAMVQVDFPVRAGSRRLLFTGDLGRRHSLLLDPPDAPEGVDYLIIESTYGGRLHSPVGDVEGAFAALIRRALAEKGKILIPSFALERTQEIVFLLEKLRRAGTIARIPVYVDSPMAVEVTDIFNRHLDALSFDPEFKEYAAAAGDPFGLDTVHYVRTKEESQALNERAGPMIILSASGMCEGGRILHHLRHNIDQPATTVLIVGHQAEGTLGRRLQDGAKKVKIFGLEHEVRARVEPMHFFSSHADQEDLFAFIAACKPRPRRIFLVHGDPERRAALTGSLQAAGITGVVSPEFGQTFALD